MGMARNGRSRAWYGGDHPGEAETRRARRGLLGGSLGGKEHPLRRGGGYPGEAETARARRRPLGRGVPLLYTDIAPDLFSEGLLAMGDPRISSVVNPGSGLRQ